MYSLALISVAKVKYWAIMKCEWASNVIKKVKISVVVWFSCLSSSACQMVHQWAFIGSLSISLSIWFDWSYFARGKKSIQIIQLTRAVPYLKEKEPNEHKICQRLGCWEELWSAPLDEQGYHQVMWPARRKDFSIRPQENGCPWGCSWERSPRNTKPEELAGHIHLWASQRQFL